MSDAGLLMPEGISLDAMPLPSYMVNGPSDNH
jgi:hypothetical protein